jgi:hypothetical protein
MYQQDSIRLGHYCCKQLNGFFWQAIAVQHDKVMNSNI